MELDCNIEYKEAVASTFKAEYSNLVSVLCNFYGIENIQIAEDIISDTFLDAVKAWSNKGIPKLPKAWLRKVAVNKANDYFRRSKIYQEKVKPNLWIDDDYKEKEIFSSELIEDSLLQMIYAVCNPEIKIDAQICLALRYLYGFTIEEIASALLSNKESVNKKLYRAKKKFQSQKDTWKKLKPSDYGSRLDNVLRVIYLLFNEGYYSTVSEVCVRRDICWESMRLGIFLSNQDHISTSKVNALMALMCFHASRFDSRIDAEGQNVLYYDQDKELWDHRLMEKGEEYLMHSAIGDEISKYHLEAIIAYWHTKEDVSKWRYILQAYNKLLTIDYSPVAALNRTYALAKVNSIKEALVEARKLNLEDNHLYYSLLAELNRMNNDKKEELRYLQKALRHATKKTDLFVINKKIDESKSI